jgi:IS30 family transposase
VRRGSGRGQLQLLAAQRRRVRTISADIITEFHQYAAIERVLGAEFYFAPPYQAWARDTCENTIGLVRRYLPKGMSFTGSLKPAPLTSLDT